MLHEVSARTLVPVTIATVTSSYVGRLVFGNHPSFVIPAASHAGHRSHRLARAALLSGAGSARPAWCPLLISAPSTPSRISSISECRATTTRRHMLGMLGVGIIMYVLLLATGHYYVEGVGLRHDSRRALGKAVLVPAGAVRSEAADHVADARLGRLGRCVLSRAVHGRHAGRRVWDGRCNTLFPGLPVDPVAFAVAGMAGVVGGSTGRPWPPSS